jgi:hypothetical protein
MSKEDNKENEKVEQVNVLKFTPIIPDEVYENLPPILADGLKHFSDPRERDVVLTSCLVILSGCFSNCKGKYANDWLGPNLYSFIVAPPASGKGSMKFAKLLGKKIQDSFIEKNLSAKAKYDSETKIWQQSSKMPVSKAKIAKGTIAVSGSLTPPAQPKYPMHFIPGNSSAAAIYKLLYESNGRGTICESEADTLTGAIKQDWGNFSHLLRSAFHHEDLSMGRSGNSLYLTVNNPHLSTLLTGTPEQVPRLISSAEDGLSSRFLFYCYSREIKWINPTPCDGCVDLNEIFKALGEEVSDIKTSLEENGNTFSLTNDQFADLSESFKVKLERIRTFEGEGAASSVYRLCIIAFRIAMILTILRNKDNLAINKELICSDQDYSTVKKMIDVYFEHSMLMYTLLPKQSKKTGNAKLGEFYTLLPKDTIFARKEANEHGKKIGISEKTVGNYLAKLLKEQLLKSPSYGNYMSIK